MEYISEAQRKLNYSLRKYKNKGIIDDKTLYIKQKIEDLIYDIEHTIDIDSNKLYKRAKDEEEMKKIALLGAIVKSML